VLASPLQKMIALTCSGMAATLCLMLQTCTLSFVRADLARQVLLDGTRSGHGRDEHSKGHRSKVLAFGNSCRPGDAPHIVQT